MKHAGSVLRPWQRVHSRPAVKQMPDRADQPVLVQVGDHAGAGVARRGERAPAEGRVEVVGVDDPRPGAAHGARDLVGREAAAQHAGRRAAAAEQRRVALQQLGVLAEVLAHQPQQILDGTLLARRCAGSGCAGRGSRCSPAGPGRRGGRRRHGRSGAGGALVRPRSRRGGRAVSRRGMWRSHYRRRGRPSVPGSRRRESAAAVGAGRSLAGACWWRTGDPAVRPISGPGPPRAAADAFRALPGPLLDSQGDDPARVDRHPLTGSPRLPGGRARLGRAAGRARRRRGDRGRRRRAGAQRRAGRALRRPLRSARASHAASTPPATPGSPRRPASCWRSSTMTSRCTTAGSTR